MFTFDVEDAIFIISIMRCYVLSISCANEESLNKDTVSINLITISLFVHA